MRFYRVGTKNIFSIFFAIRLDSASALVFSDMDIAVPSRFACLKIEDDDFQPAKPKENKKKPDKQNAKKQNKGNKQESNEKKAVNKQVSFELCFNTV